MQEKLLQGILGTEYPSEVIDSGLEETGITDRYMAAAYGFGVAKGMDMENIQGHSSGGWIPCSERLPEEWYIAPDVNLDHIAWPEYIVTIEGASKATTLHYDFQGKKWFDEDGNIYRVSAWCPIPEAYQPVQKAVGGDYKQQIMDRFMRVE